MDTCSDVASANARDVTKNDRSCIHEDADSDGASTDARICGANTNARGRSPGDTDCTIMPVSHLTRDTVVLLPLLMQSRTESSCQPYQLEHALSIMPVSPLTCDAAVAPNIMPVSPSTRDAAVQN